MKLASFQCDNSNQLEDSIDQETFEHSRSIEGMLKGFVFVAVLFDSLFPNAVLSY